MINNLIATYVMYPIAQIKEKRDILSKFNELKLYYRNSFRHREKNIKNNLIKTLTFANENVPYYKDLFKSINFKIEKLEKDLNYFNDIPYLSKDIIIEQGNRLYSKQLNDINHHLRKTGGSTGPSTDIYYDDIGLDYSAAVMLYCRDYVGKKRHKSELHFAAKFPGHRPAKIFSKDWLKNRVLNRYNIFFNSFDNKGLDEIWQQIQHEKPYLIHGHPSTMYALALYLEDGKKINKKYFKIFEPSGEHLQEYMRKKIVEVFDCKIVNRYGLAEFGVVGYDFDQKGMRILDSEGYPEHRVTDIGNEFIFTGFRNQLMPLIKYCTGDIARIEKKEDGYYMTDVMGRIHDIVEVADKKYPTHHIMDIMDHFVRGVKEFQVDLRSDFPILKVVPVDFGNILHIEYRIKEYFGDNFKIEFIEMDKLVKVGRHSKFRHVIK